MMYIPLNANLQRTLHDKMLRIWSHGAAQGGCISAFDRWWRCLPPRRRLRHKSSRLYPGERQRHHSADRDATGLYMGGFSALTDNQWQFFTFWDRTEVAFLYFSYMQWFIRKQIFGYLGVFQICFEELYT